MLAPSSGRAGSVDIVVDAGGDVESLRSLLADPIATGA
jgi:hypothetical protein